MNAGPKGWNIRLNLPPGIYEYKFIVDGQWMIDPQNPSKTLNKYDGYNSVINVKRRVEFRLCEFGDAQTVILAGDFNDWSENQFKMKKTNNLVLPLQQPNQGRKLDYIYSRGRRARGTNVFY